MGGTIVVSVDCAQGASVSASSYPPVAPLSVARHSAGSPSVSGESWRTDLSLRHHRFVCYGGRGCAADECEGTDASLLAWICPCGAAPSAALALAQEDPCGTVGCDVRRAKVTIRVDGRCTRSNQTNHDRSACFHASRNPGTIP